MKTDVVIADAGPTGLSLACQLGQKESALAVSAAA